MHRSKLTLVALALSAAAAICAGQNADPNSAGPTKNDFRLRVIEPTEGGTVNGSTVRVVVNTSTPPEVGGAKKDARSMPGAIIEVFLDNQSRGELKDANNVLTIDSVVPGNHMVAVLAKNRCGEFIDRKEVHFGVVAEAAASTTTRSSSEYATSTQTSRVEPAPAPAPAPAPRSVVAETRPSTAPPAPAPMETSRVTTTKTSEARKLPATATTDPLLLAGGLGLLVAGLALRRRA
jgi:hypothetical protein